MADIVVSGLIDRTSLGLGALEVNGSPYEIWRDGINPGGHTWEKIKAGSPFVHGKQLVALHLDDSDFGLRIKVKAASTAALRTAIGVLIAAVEQEQWQFTATIDGQTFAWLCDCADWALGQNGEIQSLPVIQKWQVMNIVTERHPIAVSGPI